MQLVLNAFLRGNLASTLYLVRCAYRFNVIITVLQDNDKYAGFKMRRLPSLHLSCNNSNTARMRISSAESPLKKGRDHHSQVKWVELIYGIELQITF